jgi:hypothetical protein
MNKNICLTSQISTCRLGCRTRNFCWGAYGFVDFTCHKYLVRDMVIKYKMMDRSEAHVTLDFFRYRYLFFT